MQAYPQTASATNADQRLSQIIKLKQLEKPDASYWRQFEQEFRSRQLTTFVQTQPIHTRFQRVCMIIARKATPPAIAAGAVALVLFAISNTRYLIQGDSNQAQPNASPVAESQARDAQETFFIVNTTEDANPTLPSFSNDTIYQINVLSSQYDTADGYQLNANPVTYTPNATGQTNGTHILRKQPNY